jgi:hypothetical protein
MHLNSGRLTRLRDSKRKVQKRHQALPRVTTLELRGFVCVLDHKMPKTRNMSFYAKSAAVAAAVAVMAAPAFAADPPSGTPDEDNNPGAVHKPDSAPPSNHGTSHAPATPGPKAGLPAKAKAYGRYCQEQSKKRSDAAPDTKGTPFSQCVTAMAKLASGKTSSPRKACKELSKKHEEDAKSTPFSRCVSQGGKLLHDQRAQDEDGEH